MLLGEQKLGLQGLLEGREGCSCSEELRRSCRNRATRDEPSLDFCAWTWTRGSRAGTRCVCVGHGLQGLVPSKQAETVQPISCLETGSADQSLV